ncbi:hypothetical protein ACJIZ3_000553 [Penstemon smallii]|uniref:Uncharacterized protein n=1 Tax=Penstemon smallii TaxID=265156 RepID=A0ABD3R2X2_9LAMI
MRKIYSITFIHNCEKISDVYCYCNFLNGLRISSNGIERYILNVPIMVYDLLSYKFLNYEECFFYRSLFQKK